MNQRVLDRAQPTTSPGRRYRRPEPRPAWSCENCASHNLGRRRRCVDCGTTRD